MSPMIKGTHKHLGLRGKRRGGGTGLGKGQGRGGVAGGCEKGDALVLELGRPPKVGRLGGEGQVTWQDVPWGQVCNDLLPQPQRGPHRQPWA